MKGIKIEVEKIEGICPVFEKGDEIIIEGASLNLADTDAYCVWASTSWMPYLHAIRGGVPADEIGLSHEKDTYYVQCLDPGKPYTPGGTVVFKIELLSD
ncbi:MAG: TIGR04076 family protein [Candidatus Thorarchaeota archaeon]|nr:TIGR04076 family protein [Candidatus Thorarchaeota archaeon]